MSEPTIPDIRLRVISLGAGVQSTTLLLLAAKGEIGPMPDCAIFADTQAEPAAVYRHLEYLRGLGLPIEIRTVTAGSLVNEIGAPRPRGRWPKMPIPAFVVGRDGRGALLNRSCTQDYKIAPIRREVRRLLGIARRRSPKNPVCEQWIGISTDEAHRMKDSREAWRVNRWPLIEQGMSRADCLRWLAANGYPQPPKSSCTFCPFHDAAQWRAVQSDLAAWAQAVEVDERIRHLWAGRVDSKGLYLHRSMKPLPEALKASNEQPDLWGNECEGVCGV